MIRLLHFADLHLDATFPVLGPTRRVDLRGTLGRILAIARERHVDAVTIAGDLYEQDYALPDTAAFLVQQFARLAPIRVFIAPGECDPYTSDSLYARTRWPDNVTIFSQGQLTPIGLASGVHLWGASCPPARGRETLDSIHTDSAGTNVLLLHAGDIDECGTRPTDVFAVTSTAVQAAGFACALLGHRHGARFWPDGDPNCLYPGSPEPLDAETDEMSHTAALVTVQQNHCTVEHITVNQWRHRALSVDLTGCDNVAQAAMRVQQALGPNEDAQLIFEVTLTGIPDVSLDAAAVLAQVDTPAHLYGQADFAFSFDLDGLSQEQTVRGLLVRRYQARLAQSSATERQQQLTSLRLALQALEGKPVDPW